MLPSLDTGAFPAADEHIMHHADTGQCAIILELDTLAQQRYQRVSWYDIWQQAESVLGTCLREGQGGFGAVRGQTPGKSIHFLHYLCSEH